MSRLNLKIQIPFTGDYEFNDLVDQFESLAEETGSQVIDNEKKGEIEYKTYSCVSITIKVAAKIEVINPMRQMKCLELLDAAAEAISGINSTGRKLLF